MARCIYRGKNVLTQCFVSYIILAPGSPATGGYVDASLTVPAEGSYEEEWEVFDP